MVSAMFQTIFQQPDAQSTWAPAREVVDLLEPKFPQVPFWCSWYGVSA